MSRQVSPYEKLLNDVVVEYNNRFYYESIYRLIDGDQFKIKIEKDKEEMVGRAFVSFQSGDRIDFEIRYNRIVNLTEGYTIVVQIPKAV